MRRLVTLLLGLSALLLAFAVYFPGLNGGFVFDDTVNIVANDRLRMAALDVDQLKSAAMSGMAGIFGRPVSMATFALDHWRSGGLDPRAFKLSNLLIHLATGMAVFAFVRLLLQAHQMRLPEKSPSGTIGWISLAVATAWLVHPLNLTSVLYVVQRMTSLAALFSLLALASYLWGRLRVARTPDRRGWLAIGASFIVFTPLAALSKENGALVPLFLLLTEVTFFRFETHSAQASRALKGVFLVTVALPALFVLGYTVVSPGWITDAYNMRNFSMGERLLTETRVLWLYVRLAFMPDLTLLGLYHDDLVVSTSLLNPVTTLSSTIGLAALVTLVLAAWRRHRLLAYGIAFFLLGHTMESSFLALELMHEHRNYFPLIGLLLPLFYYLISASRHVDHRATLIGAVLALVAIFAGITVLRAGQWGKPVDMLVKEVEHHPGSTRAHLALANFYLATPPATQADADLFYQNAYQHFALAAEIAPTDPIGLFGLVFLHGRVGLPLDPSWQPALLGRIRNNPVAASTVSATSRLTTCYIEKKCHVEPALLEAILETAVANPNNRISQRMHILFAWSSFLLHVKKDVDGAMKAAYEAAALVPNDLFAQEVLVSFLVNANRDDEARIRLAALQRMDRLQLFTSKINNFDAILKKRQDAAKATVKQP